MSDEPSACLADIAVVGGGRWAREVAGVLLALCKERRALVLCSPSNPQGWRDWMQTRSHDEQDALRLQPNLEEILADERIGYVCVVRAARDHATTALLALRAGKKTFIEKPFAVSLDEAWNVVAASRGLRCMTGNVLLFAPNLRRFAEELKALGALLGVSIRWCDASREMRHGTAKTYDHSINVIEDVFPHVWSLLRLVMPDAPLSIESMRLSCGGRGADLLLTCGAAAVDVHLERNAERRERRMSVASATRKAEIDFTIEPGFAKANGRTIDVSSDFSSPLRRELACFLEIESDPLAFELSGVEKAREAIELAAALRPSIDEQQLAAIREGAAHSDVADKHEAALFALRERLARARDTWFPDRFSGDEVAGRALEWLSGRSGGASFPAEFFPPWLRQLSKELGR